MSGHLYSLNDLAIRVGGRLVGDPTTEIHSLSTIQNASLGCISFLANPKYKKYLSQTKASAVIIHPDNESHLECSGIIVDDPYAAYALISSLFVSFKNPYQSMAKNFHAHSTSVIHETAIIGPNVYIGPNCMIGKDSIIHANCSLVMNVEIGEHSIVHANSVLGSDGFGYAADPTGYLKIEQLGNLLIGNNVEIGAACTIDRGAIEHTEIHDGVKLDNQVHIAHNVILGQNSAIAASCAIAGSTVIGKNLQMGGLSGILGHLNICDNVLIGAHTLITKDIDMPGDYIGIMPAQKKKDWAKSSVFIKKRNAK
ncbi:MAG: UDP-3-O-(3-hydroxymyristoyl) glucosamine N-acyltransferase [SAR86 cluster bacterium BACL1 MAG-121105-bin34]|nr:MAG: UDP-3-O-(3-hydroxymyristoyl) glucosamine N-acyltransferase [SAR86 cluster bacterium BACL1 MAG-120619-bin26]KRP08771.1 MAG: UDP-3-O-(3-hydroxymyristoyl) glucosamine N-acyltransferase [SAR86 cluster bacterium BACL1 MAG-121004-bin11]KRP13070.1 MAG: UDP-3-O-(3-hydroxymyristoyl) glucosamine N-acyltransferase [SAR86 cluster bacterium BACL1 MAG-121105-bin34]KRP16602.1 MAG: UDP-3-O-(3-hydroxymyristoyl) glucosamine N-acyltransferase [SAR86 cluster bacterium BACL1 MAG-121128-bin56]MDA0758646.1 UD